MPKIITRDKEGNYIMIKAQFQEDITIVNILVCAPNIRGPKYIKQILRNKKREIENNTIIANDFNTPLSTMGRSTSQKINKETLDVNHTLDQMELTNI